MKIKRDNAYEILGNHYARKSACLSLLGLPYRIPLTR